MTQGEELHEIFIVEEGVIEVYLEIGGQDVVLERLFRGSVINYKNILSYSK